MDAIEAVKQVGGDKGVNVSWCVREIFAARDVGAVASISLCV